MLWYTLKKKDRQTNKQAHMQKETKFRWRNKLDGTNQKVIERDGQNRKNKGNGFVNNTLTTTTVN